MCRDEMFQHCFHHLTSDVIALTLCRLKPPKRFFFAKSEDRDEMLHQGLHNLLKDNEIDFFYHNP